LVPEGQSEQVSALIGAAGQANWELLACVQALVEGLDRLLQAEGLILDPARIPGGER